MLKLDHRFVIEILRPDGESLGQFDAAIDWEPARESVRLLQMRRGAAAGGDSVRVEPVWDKNGSGEPYATGARLVAGETVCEIEKDYFKSLAVEISTALVEKQVLKAGDLYLYKILAYRDQSKPREMDGTRFTIRDATPRLTFVESSLAGLSGAAVACADCDSEDVPVFIPQNVLDEVEALTREADTKETGGILIGHLHRDSRLPDVAVVVTAQIPAPYTLSQTTKLTFTAETWTAVQAALDLRQSGELMVGWFHSHPSFAFCNAECPPERRAACSLQKPFLSSEDLLLHRAVFPKAWQVALLCNNAEAGLEFALFGWRHGLVRRRGFTIPGAAHPPGIREANFSNQKLTGGTTHATACRK